MLRLSIFAATVVLASVSSAQGEVVVETVTVGDPGNPDDTHGNGHGSVGYEYRIGKYEVTNAQYAEFLNAVAGVGDPNDLYDTDMGGGWNDIGGISRTGSGTDADPWVHAARSNRGNRPVNYVSWYDALRFANWMHNGQPTGVQDDATTEDGAYDMELGAAVVRKPGARVFLPSEDEWYKAAYYKGGGINAGYWDYPTETDDPNPPTAEAPPGTETAYGSAHWYDGAYVDPTYYTTNVGAYNTEDPPGSYVSDSAYGTFDQGGNLWEWNEADFLDASVRGIRGGSFNYDYIELHAANGSDAGYPNYGYYYVGFRVAEVPEQAPVPAVSSWGLGVLALLILTTATLICRCQRQIVCHS